MLSPINRIIFIEQLGEILRVMFEHKAQIIRFMQATGRNSIVWIWIRFRSGKTAAFFLSRQELNIAFCRWLNRIQNLREIRLDFRRTISRAQYRLIQLGDKVWHRFRNSLGVVVSKGVVESQPIVFVDWGGGEILEENRLYDLEIERLN
jgi:hypothetical protein